MSFDDKNFNKSAFSKNLKRLMKKNNIKNIDLAKKLNLSKSAISNYIAGTSVPRTDVVSKIANIFGVKIESMFKEKFELEMVLDSSITIRKPGVSTSFHEDGLENISYYQAPMFINELYNSDIIYIDRHFCGRILSTFPFYGDFECYSLIVREDNLIKSGLPKGATAIFAATLDADKDELAAVLYKEELKIRIRRVEFLKDQVILKTDETEEKYKYNARNCPVTVLGKVVNVMFSPN